MTRRPFRIDHDLALLGVVVLLVWAALLGTTIAGAVLGVLVGHGWLLTPKGLLLSLRDGSRATYGVPGWLLALATVVVASSLLGLLAHVTRRFWRVPKDWRQAERETRIANSPVWARRADVPTLIASPVTESRIVLGDLVDDGATIAARREHSVIVIAPPRSGKTVGVVIPAILRWRGPAIITSTKRDVFDVTIRHRESLGPVWVFDPTGASGRPCAKWSPIPGCETWTMAEDVAHWLVQAARVEDAADRASFWETQAEMLIAPLLHAAALEELYPSHVLAWVQRGAAAADEIRLILARHHADDALLSYNAALALPPETLGGVMATALNLFRSYGSARMRHLTSVDPGDSDAIDWDELIDTNGTLYLLASDSDQQLLRPVFEAMLAALMRRVAVRYLASGTPLDPRLLLMLDEAPHVASPMRLPEWLNSYSGQGVTAVTVWQDLAQIEEIYGSARARAVWTGHPAKLLLGGISDTATLSAMRDLIGDQAITATSESWSHRGDVSTSESSGDLDVAPVAWLRRRPTGTAIGLVAEHQPMQLVTRPWFSDPDLSGLVPDDVRSAMEAHAR